MRLNARMCTPRRQSRPASSGLPDSSTVCAAVSGGRFSEAGNGSNATPDVLSEIRCTAQLADQLPLATTGKNSTERTNLNNDLEFERVGQRDLDVKHLLGHVSELRQPSTK